MTPGTASPAVRSGRGRTLLAVGLGGAAGALARYGVLAAVSQPATGWPTATFLINMTGCVILGFLVTLLAEGLVRPWVWRALIGTGFCGAYTTFSTFCLEVVQRIERGAVGVAVAYGLVSLVAGLACAVLGDQAARRLVGWRRPGGRAGPEAAR